MRKRNILPRSFLMRKRNTLPSSSLKRVRASAIALIFALAALALALVPVASAAPLSDADGAPNVTDSSPTGWFVFHDENGFHIRTHGPQAEHDFYAVLRSKGTFENVDMLRLEQDDRVDVVDGGHTMLIHFHTFDGIDGVNFTVRGGDALHLNLKLDHQETPTDQIFLGPFARHPDRNPFRIEF